MKKGLIIGIIILVVILVGTGSFAYFYMSKNNKNGSTSKEPTLGTSVAIGDYVNYDATSNGEYKYTTSEDLTGTVADDITYSSTDEVEWRVLSVNQETNEITLVAADTVGSKLYLGGTEGYTNSEKILNDICAVYGHGKGAIEGRSINLSDIENKISSYEKSENYDKETTYTTGTFINEKGSLVTATTESPITMKHTYYKLRNVDSYTGGDTTLNRMLFYTTKGSSYKRYWLATSTIYACDDDCCFIVDFIADRDMGGRTFYSSVTGLDKVAKGYYVLPIVVIKADLQTSGQDSNGVWQINVD